VAAEEVAPGEEAFDAERAHFGVEELILINNRRGDAPGVDVADFLHQFGEQFQADQEAV
jgi:hypothetical protein